MLFLPTANERVIKILTEAQQEGRVNKHFLHTCWLICVSGLEEEGAGGQLDLEQ